MPFSLRPTCIVEGPEIVRAPVVVKVPVTSGNVEKSYTPVMVTGVRVEADPDASEPIVKKAVTHSAIATEIILLCCILIPFLDVEVDGCFPFTKGFRRRCCMKSPRTCFFTPILIHRLRESSG